MQQLGGAGDGATERRTDRLVAEADAEHRQLARVLVDDVHHDAGAFRRARARGEQHPGGAEAGDLGHSDLVVAPDLALGAQLAQILHQVEDERVVVVDHEDAHEIT